MPFGDEPTEPVEVETPLVNDPEHGGVVDTELEAAAQAAWPTPDADAPAATTDTGDDDDPEPEVVADGGTEGTEGTGREGVPVPSEPDVIEIADGITMAREDAAEWARFQQYLAANPAVAQRVAAALEEQQTPAPPPASEAPAPPAVPEGIDLDDPAIAALWNQHLATLEHMGQIEATLARHDQYVQTNEMATTESLLNTARATYQEKHHLSDAEMAKVYEVTGRLQVLPAILGSVDPITGQPRQIDSLTAMLEAFEVGRWQVPELRERELQSQLDQQKSDTKRKKKLSSLGGSSGSAPKTVAVPKNAIERRNAMIQAVAEMTGMNGEGEN